MSKMPWCQIIILMAVTLANSALLPLSKSSGQLIIENAGVNYTFHDDNPVLNFEEATQVCAEGVWLVFGLQNYETSGEGSYTSMYTQLEPNCRPPMYPNVGSARFIGHKDDYTAPVASVFTEQYFEGVEYTFEAIPQIKFNVSSIVAIRTSVEFFKKENYDGDSHCYTPHNCNDGVCYSMRWTGWDNLPWDITFAKSAKIGC